MLLVSVACPLLIAPSVFSNVKGQTMLPVSVACPFLIAASLFSNAKGQTMLPVSVFSNVYLLNISQKTKELAT